MKSLSENEKRRIIQFQKNEITEYYVYKVLSRLTKSGHNREIIAKISDEELKHYNIWKEYSGKEVKPDNLKRWFYIAVSVLFGVTFAIKLMEKGETSAQVSYKKFSSVVSEAEDLEKEENEHENQLVRMIEEDRLNYMGSVVLGLNDALVEFTGALAGFTFALQNSRLIGVVALIMGFSASLSMGASEYLSTKTEETDKAPLKASLYTGLAYMIAVMCLIIPFFMFTGYLVALGLTILIAVLLILVFTFYYSVVKEISFRRRFSEMFVISMGVAAVSFAIGLFIRKVLHIDV